MRTRRRAAVAAALAAASAVLVACGDAGGPATDGTTLADLAGTAFGSTEVRGRTLVAGTQVRLAFDDGRLTASAGCNTFLGLVDVVEATLQVSQLGGTEMACDADRTEQDEWLTTLLTSSPSLRLTGSELDLGSAASGLRLTALPPTTAAADPDRPVSSG